MKNKRMIFLAIVLLVASGCATIPTGPSVMVLPSPGKSFEQFQADDAVCRQFAYAQVGGVTGQEAAQKSAVSSAVIGTAVGAAAGAAIGSATGNFGAGAAIGAGSGLLLGSAAGAGYASGSYYEAQRRYDIAYMQCMYSRGNRIPGMTTRRPRRVAPPPPDLSYETPARPPSVIPPPPPSPQPTAKVIDKMTLRVNFDVDRSIIRSSDKAALDKVVDFVKKYPNARIELDGYTDNRGTEAHNRRLSEKRAQAVKRYLQKEAGVDESRISTFGRGESNPVADNKTEEGRFENRRVEILILQK